MARTHRLNLPRPPGMVAGTSSAATTATTTTSTGKSATENSSNSSRNISTSFARPRASTTTTTTSSSISGGVGTRNRAIGNRFALPPGSTSSRSTLGKTTPLTTPVTSPEARNRPVVKTSGTNVVGFGSTLLHTTASKAEANLGTVSSSSTTTTTTQKQQAEENQSTITTITAPPRKEPETVPPTLPEGWVEAIDPNTGSPYFYHAATNMTQWERPTIIAPADNAATPPAEQKQPTQSSQLAETEKENTKTTTDLLPDGWVEIIDETSGKPYYFHAKSNQTSWVLPSFLITEQPKQDNKKEPTPVEQPQPQEPTPESEIQKESKDTTLPDGWVQLIDETSGNPYYYNAELNQTSWEPPSVPESTQFTTPISATDETTTQLPDDEEEKTEKQDVAKQAQSPVNEQVQVPPVKHDQNSAHVVGVEDTKAQSTVVDHSPQTTPMEEQKEFPVVEEQSQIPTVEEETKEVPTLEQQILGQERQQKDDVTAAAQQPQPQPEELHEIPSPEQEIANKHPEVESENEQITDQEKEDTPELVGQQQEEASEVDAAKNEAPTPEEEPPLPAGWQELVDDGSGMIYFFHEKKGITQWERPQPENPENTRNVEEALVAPTTETALNKEQEQVAGVSFPEETAPLAQKDGIEPTGKVDGSSTSEKGDEDDLPLGWKQYLDETTGLPYYVNDADGTVQWERPVAPADHENNKNEAEPSMSVENLNSPEDLPENSPVEGKHEGIDVATQNEDLVATNLEQEPVQEPEKQRGEDLTTEEMPPGWVKLMDDATGLPYYMNELDGTTTWDLPVTTQEVAVEKQNLDNGGKFSQDDNAEDVFEDVDIDEKPDTRGPRNSVPENDADMSESVEESESPEEIQTKTIGLESTPEKSSEKPPLPMGWVKLADESTGEPYYLFEFDGTTQRERPTGIPGVSSPIRPQSDHIFEKETERKKTHASADEAEIFPGVNNGASGTEELPPGWVQLYDETSGIPYYYCELENKTQWERPVLQTNEESDRNEETSIAKPNNDDNLSKNHLQKSVESKVSNGDNLQSFDNAQTSDTKIVDSDRSDGDKIDGVPKGASPELPFGWIELIDETSGMPYYLYEPDNTTQWDRPAAVLKPDDKDAITESKESDGVTSNGYDEIKTPAQLNEHIRDNTIGFEEPLEQETKNETGESEQLEGNATELPPGWIEIFDETTGLPYYLYEPDNTTQWDRPTDETIDGREKEGTEKPIESVSTSEAVEKIADDHVHNEEPESTENVAENVAVDVVPNDETNDGEQGEVKNDQVESADSGLPPGWVELVDETSGMPFFFHEADNVTQWDRPILEFNGSVDRISESHISPGPGLTDSNEESEINLESKEDKNEEMEIKDDIDTKENVIDDDKFSSDEGNVTDEASSELPFGWIQLVDESSGMPYYLYEADNTTQWERPTAVLEPSNKDANVKASESDVVTSFNSKEYKTREKLNDHIREDNAVVEESIEQESKDEKLEGNAMELPPGWVEIFDETAGLPYYLYEPDNTTQWDRPIDAAFDGGKQDVIEEPGEPGEPVSTSEVVEKVEDDQDHNEEPESTENLADNVAADVIPDDSVTDREFSEAQKEQVEGDDSGLPLGWVELVDETSGMPYFFHEVDSITQWERPMPLDPVTEDEGKPAIDSEGDQANSSFDGVIEYEAGKNRAASSIDDNLQGDENDELVLNTEMITPELPPGWIELIDETSRTPYYLYEPDNTTQWERPTTGGDDSSKSLQNGHSVGLEDAQSTAEDGVNTNDSSKEANLELPVGWVELIDESTGMTYFFRASDSKIQWERPTEGGTLIEDKIVDDTLEESGEATEGMAESEETSPTTFTDRGESTNIHVKHLPPGWVELVEESSGLPYYFNEAENITQWEKPLVDDDQANHKLPSQAVDVPTKNLRKTGFEKPVDIRPAHALATFGFGGRLCVVRQRGNKQSDMKVFRTFSLVPKDPLVRIEKFKKQRNISGPLNSCDDKTVQQYIEIVSKNDFSFLWSLVRIASLSHGKLRSDAGIDDPDSPESKIVELLMKNMDDKTRDCLCHLEKSEVSSNQKTAISDHIQDLLFKGLRDAAADEAIRSQNYALSLLVGSMCGRDVFRISGKAFADGSFQHGHPMHTLVMLFSGNLSAESASSYWDIVDPATLRLTWKLHLSAIISNRTNEWEYLLIALGDRLMAVGEVEAAHFCFMVCGCPFSSPHRPDSRLTLLGCNVTPADLVLRSVDSVIALERTEAYEWSKRRGNHNALIPCLQSFKLMYAMMLADYGFNTRAMDYVKHVADCISEQPVDEPAASSIHGPVAIYLLMSDNNSLLAALRKLENRLLAREEYANHDTEKLNMGRSGQCDEDTSFVTAKTNFHDASRFDEKTNSVEVIKKPSIPGSPGMPMEGFRNTEFFSPQKEQERVTNSVEFGPTFQSGSQASVTAAGGFGSIADNSSEVAASDQVFSPAGESKANKEAEPNLQNPESNSEPNPKESTQKANGFKSPPATTGSTFAKPGGERSSTSKTTTAPKSAPANLERSFAKSPSSGGLFGSFREKMTKFLNPNVKIADTGEEMQAYYDEKLKVWVFPGEDPAEKAKPIGPPPTTPTASTTTDVGFPSPNTSTKKDPLAAMMAPPSRGPAALRRKPGVAPATMMYPAGMGTPSAATGMSAPPQFAVFAPVPKADTTTTDKSDE